MIMRSPFMITFTRCNLFFLFAIAFAFTSCGQVHSENKTTPTDSIAPGKTGVDSVGGVTATKATTLDTAAYDALMMQITNKDSSGKWPVKAPYPLAGALLPFNRIVAFYGNLYSTKMGVLGEYPRKEMLAKLQEEVVKWQAADTTVKVIPALHYIAVTAQGSPGAGNKFRRLRLITLRRRRPARILCAFSGKQSHVHFPASAVPHKPLAHKRHEPQEL